MEEQINMRTFWVGFVFLIFLLIQLIFGSDFFGVISSQICKGVNPINCEGYTFDDNHYWLRNIHQFLGIISYYSESSIWTAVMGFLGMPIIGMIFHVIIDVVCRCFNCGPFHNIKRRNCNIFIYVADTTKIIYKCICEKPTKCLDEKPENNNNALFERQLYLEKYKHLRDFIRRRYTGFYVGLELALAFSFSIFAFLISIYLTNGFNGIHTCCLVMIYLLIFMVVLIALCNSCASCNEADFMISSIDKEIKKLKRKKKWPPP